MSNNYLYIISNISQKIVNKDYLYLTFSKTIYNKYRDNFDILYFFDINPDINEFEFSKELELNLFKESKGKKNRWFILTYKFIYKYLLTYNQFYNRFTNILSNNREIKIIEISSNISFILKLVLENITSQTNLEVKYNDNKFTNFSYRHSQYMASDLPKLNNIDNHNIYLILYSLYLRVVNHRIFLFPPSPVIKLPKHANIFRISIFSIFSKIKRYFGYEKNKSYLRYFSIIDFSLKQNNVYTLNNNLWNSYRSDQIRLTEHIINNFFTAYPDIYLDKLKEKMQYYLKMNNTKKVIIDETIDSFRKLTCMICKEIGVEIEFTPHGMIDEGLQFPLIDNNEYIDKYMPDVLAWNKMSAKYFKDNNINNKAISYPIVLCPRVVAPKKDLLIMLSYGDRVNLNAFEEDMNNLIFLQKDKNLSVDWKIHHNIFEDSNESMKVQKEFIEDTYNLKINMISHERKSSSILQNYKTIIFLTWTTGIYEAALLNVPFIIYTKEKEIIRAVDNIKIPIAKNTKDLYSLIGHNDLNYLNKIKKSLTDNIKLESYLKA